LYDLPTGRKKQEKLSSQP